VRRAAKRYHTGLNIAVLGFGFMGATHAAAIAKLPGAKLAAVVTRNAAQRARGNLETGAGTLDLSNTRILPAADGVYEDPSIDAVDICLPTPLHAPAALAALKHGKHVLVEKPMALTEQDLDAMLEAARGSGRVFMAAHVLRFHPAYDPLRAFAASGELGRLRALTLQRACPAPTWSEWFADPNQTGGAAVDLLIHDFDIALSLLGPPAAIRARGYAEAGHGIDVLEAGLLYPGGVICTVSGGWRGRIEYPFRAGYTAVFDRGVLELAGGVALYRGDEAEKLAVPEENAYAAEIGYFLDCCRQGTRPERCMPEDSARAVRLALLARASRNQGGRELVCQI
jgi:predicted dehydrogenase